MKAIYAADLFCGAGGSSTGMARACETLGRKLQLTAVNHWTRAVETHALNHPKAAHFCQDLATMDPKAAVPGGKLDLLIASPECTHHSNARGGKPVNDQSRASAWCVLRWCTALKVDRVLIENVPEFRSWGPVGAQGQILVRRKGETFRAFYAALASLGYRVECRILNAADYGAATTRKRLFIQAVRGKRPIRWPEQTHESKPSPGLIEPLHRWRAAREVIDWTLRGSSIFGRKRPLSPNTLKRIEAGLKKFGGKNAEPYLVMIREGIDRRCHSIDKPVPTLAACGNHVGLCEPFLVTSRNGCVGRKIGEPLPTITTGQPAVGLVEPFLIPTNYGEREGQSPRCHSINQPCPTVVASGQTHALVEPFVLSAGGPNVDARSIRDPLNTVLTRDHMGMVEPFVMSCNGQAHEATDPLLTVTTRDRLELVEPHANGMRLDILFRMLQPNELASAMGFPSDYKITGNRSEQVKQIGNAVEVNQAAALVRAMLEES